MFLLLSCIFLTQCGSEKKQAKTIPAVTEKITSTPPAKPIPNYIDIAYVMGKFSIQDHKMLERIDAQYADNNSRYMHKDAYAAFQQMSSAAKKDGIQLTIRSAARNFEYQKGIWERKWKGTTLLEGQFNAKEKYTNPKERAKAILRYSSMPGSSRHHWGTDIDINAFENSYFEKGEGLKVYNWLVGNAHKYGYCQPYTKKDENRPHGYEEEKWHWSYLPVANECMRLAEKEFKNELISGFLGSEQAVALDVYTHFIRGINKSCLD